MGRFGTPLISFDRYNAMAKALKATGRSILYSLCNWGEDYVYTVRRPTQYGNSCCFESRLIFRSGARQLPTRGVYSETSTILLLARTIFAPARIQPILSALRLERTVRCWPSSTEWLPTSTVAYRVAGTISISLRSDVEGRQTTRLVQLSSSHAKDNQD